MIPIITVVSGTINRLPLLQKMVASARREARGLPIDFIIVDNGSTDGTENWCKTQPDIHFIQLGKPVGGIKAFTVGGMQSKARYTILANDDIEFLPYSILSAYRHLEAHRTCGAVAFADNRLNPHAYQTQQHLTRINDVLMMTTYAQVGMYRTELMQVAGVWGGDDPLFGGAGAWTYGGDNYLSAQIFEMGYSICETKLAKIQDHVHKDETRVIGEAKHGNDSRLFHARFANYPTWKRQTHIAPPLPADEKLRVLYLPEIEAKYPVQVVQKRGLEDALRASGFDVLRYNYGLFSNPIQPKKEVVNIVNIFKPHLCLLQAHSSFIFDPKTVFMMRRACPSMVMVNWNGDYWRTTTQNPDYIRMVNQMDCQLVVDHALIPLYAKHGVKAFYWQIAPEEPTPFTGHVPEYDVLFMGSPYSKFRVALVELLNELRQKYRVGLYGNRYPPHIHVDGETYYDFSYSQALTAKAKIVIGVMEFPDTDGYVSNRLFETLQSKGFLLQQRLVNADVHLGLMDGVHYVSWDTLDDLKAKIDEWIDKPDDRQKIAQAGYDLIQQRHTWSHRVDELFEILEKLRHDD